jgi:hypothetical protein
MILHVFKVLYRESVHLNTTEQRECTKHKMNTQKDINRRLVSQETLVTVFVLTFGSLKFVSTTFGRAFTLDFRSSGVLRKNRSF